MFIKILLMILLSTATSVKGSEPAARVNFVVDLLYRIQRPFNIVSLLNLSAHEHFILNKQFMQNNVPVVTTSDLELVNYNDYMVYLADFESEDFLGIIQQAETLKRLITPAIWVLFKETQKHSPTFEVPKNDSESDKKEVEEILKDVYLAINSEIYIAFQHEESYNIYLAHRIKKGMPLIWESYGIWDPSSSFDRPAPNTVLAMRRRDINKMNITTTAVIFHKDSFEHMKDYLFRELDTLSKVMYYMSLHLFEWMNGTGHINTTNSWGYRKPDGTYDGIVRELYDERSDFSGSVMIPMNERIPAVDYVLPPGPIDVCFIFRKPSLASVANIYSLPFSLGVWISIVLLIIISSCALFCTSLGENNLISDYKFTLAQRVSQGLHDTLCLVFQQGTAVDPVSLSSRQILLLGLLAFMFLYTAYSANVVAILQSATNDINSVETLLNSPLQCGAQDVVYNREIFTHEKRPIHKALWLKKGAPQGEDFFLSVEEGIRRVREGMYAFHVEPTAGYDRIKKTFLEHEKCNLGVVKYTEFVYPYVGISRKTPIKEALRIGVIRILESGVQSRTTRRVLSAQPQCGAGSAMFTAVRLMDVAPAFKCMAGLYAMALAIFVLEIAVSKKCQNQRPRGDKIIEM